MSRRKCRRCGSTEFVCAPCNHIITGEAADAIRREIREGTPNTPERIENMRRADEVYEKWRGILSPTPAKAHVTDLANSESRLASDAASIPKVGDETP